MCVRELVDVIVTTVLTQVGSWSVRHCLGQSLAWCWSVGRSQAWCSPKSTGGNKFGLKLILKIGQIQMAKVAEVFMKSHIMFKENHEEQKVFLEDF